MIKFLDIMIPITFIITLITTGVSVQNFYIYFMGFCAGAYYIFRRNK